MLETMTGPFEHDCVCTYSSIIAKDVPQPGSQTILGTELDAPNTGAS